MSLVVGAGVEPTLRPNLGLLAYKTSVLPIKLSDHMVLAVGIEPTSAACKTAALPLDEASKRCADIGSWSRS